MTFSHPTTKVMCDYCDYEEEIELCRVVVGIPHYHMPSLDDYWYELIEGKQACEECFNALRHNYDPRTEALTAAERNPGGV